MNFAHRAAASGMHVVVAFVGLALTLLLACLLMVGGLFRIIAALTYRFSSWGWPLFSGIIGLILGVMIWMQWPASALWVIGLFLGISLIFRGGDWIGAGLAVHSGFVQFSGVQHAVTGALTNQPGSQMILTGAGTTTFNSVVNNVAGSNVRIDAGRTAVFASNVTGLGQFSGAGSKIFRGAASGLAQQPRKHDRRKHRQSYERGDSRAVSHRARHRDDPDLRLDRQHEPLERAHDHAARPAQPQRQRPRYRL